MALLYGGDPCPRCGIILDYDEIGGEREPVIIHPDPQCGWTADGYPATTDDPQGVASRDIPSEPSIEMPCAVSDPHRFNFGIDILISGTRAQDQAVTCFLCGAADDLMPTEVGMACTDEAACAARLANWRPTGIQAMQPDREP